MNLQEKWQNFCLPIRKQTTPSTATQFCPLRCSAVISLSLFFPSSLLRNRLQLTKGHSSPGLGAIVMLSDSERQKSMSYWLTLNGGSAQLICEVYPQEPETLVRETHMQHFAGCPLVELSFHVLPFSNRSCMPSESLQVIVSNSAINWVKWNNKRTRFGLTTCRVYKQPFMSAWGDTRWFDWFGHHANKTPGLWKALFQSMYFSSSNA